MNPWQFAQQIRHELRNVQWQLGSKEVVFGDRGAFVFGGAPVEAAHPMQFPFALVTIDGGVPDEDDPDLIMQQFSVAVAARVMGDKLGEGAVIGRNRPGEDYGKSAGAGCAELAERARAAVQRMTAFSGGAIVVSASGTETPGPLAQLRHVAVESFTVTAMCTSQPRQIAPQQLRLAGDTWRWEGSYCTDRFDFVEFELAFVEGSTPAASYAEMEGSVYTGTDEETAVGGVAGRVYHLFARYNGHGGSSTLAETSPVEVGSYIIV